MTFYATVVLFTKWFISHHPQLVDVGVRGGGFLHVPAGDVAAAGARIVPASAAAASAHGRLRNARGRTGPRTGVESASDSLSQVAVDGLVGLTHRLAGRAAGGRRGGLL